VSDFDDHELLYWERALNAASWEQVSKLPFGDIFYSAVKGNCRVEMSYRSEDGRITERIVFPLRAVKTNQAFYVQAYCFLRDEERTFRFDRIVKADTIGGSFNIPHRYSLGKKESSPQPPKTEPRTTLKTQQKSYTWLFWVIIIAVYVLWRLFTK